MDPPNEERAQPTSTHSSATPPSKRGQPSSNAAGTDQQSAAASAHPTGPTGAPAVADSVAAGHSVSAASRHSPAERCPSDPLSVALSFLNTRDFAVASHVCRHWRQAAELQSAWPEFSVERLISGLIQDENHWSQSRSVRVSEYHLGLNALEQVMQSRKWRRLTELHLFSFYQSTSDEQVPLGEVAHLPQLRSLRMESIRLSDVAAAFSVMAPRLQALKCHTVEDAMDAQPHLHLLVNLRVLSLNQEGHIDNDGRALLPLHQLEYLQLHKVLSVRRDLLLAIRRLSAQHRLRHLSVTSRYWSVPADLDLLAGELDGSDAGLAPAALVSIRLFGILSEASRSALLSLPSLTRLEWSSTSFMSEPATPPHSSPSLSPSPSPLQRLHLDGGAVQLLQLAAVRAPQLRELHIGHLPASFEQLVRPLRSLCLLNIKLPESSELSQELLQSLASLPLFAELILRHRMRQLQPLHLVAETLRCIAESPSWRLIRLIGWLDPPLLTLPGDANARLAERLADFRVHSEWSSRTISQRLIIGADGTAMWQQTAI